MQKPRVLVTGVSGFVGTHLVSLLLSSEQTVFGIDKVTPQAFGASREGLTLEVGDIRDKDFLRQVLNEIKPGVIYHLAGVIKAKEVETFYETNVLGSVALFETIRELDFKPRVLISSSSAVYGSGYRQNAIGEEFKYRARTPYAMSKVMQELTALHYHSVHGIAVICARTFNLIGPGQSSDLACSNFAYQIAQAETTQKAAPILVGNLQAFRDFVDVRDTVRAYQMLAVSGKAGEFYNVCSAKGISMEECLRYLISLANVPIEVIPEVSRFQKNDIPYQVGNNKKIASQMGWTVKISIQQSLQDLLNYWRYHIKY
ncbi:MAG: GDP-mannose 4,6-dehydratase [Chloroflexota bacterium]